MTLYILPYRDTALNGLYGIYFVWFGHLVFTGRLILAKPKLTLIKIQKINILMKPIPVTIINRKIEKDTNRTKYEYINI